MNETHIGTRVMFNGWVQSKRDHQNLIFIDLRDRSGIVQVVASPDTAPEAYRVALDTKSEDVLAVIGNVIRRPEGTENPKLPTGAVELQAEEIHLLSSADTLPFPVGDQYDEQVENETVRLRYRYLDLRRPRMQRNLRFRHQIVTMMRDYLNTRGFIEVETPILTKSTPEGARDYLVPSRLRPGKFYALPQSPQQLKQLLMIAGIDKYYQIARCFRDEDLRADRQPEFSQLDIEMSFIDESDVIALISQLMVQIAELAGKKILTPLPFPFLTYEDAIATYGTDKPDLRFALTIVDVTDIFKETRYRVFRDALAESKCIKSICVPGGASLGENDINDLKKCAEELKAKGLTWIDIVEGSSKSPVAKHFLPDEILRLTEKMQAQKGDLLLFVADDSLTASRVLGQLRLQVATKLNLLDSNALAFAWIVDFPLLEWNKDENHWEAMHHPFTAPKEEDLELLMHGDRPESVRARAYDIVLNGIELGGGSIRIHQPKVQEAMFRMLGYTKEHTEEKFGYFLKAFQYGTPPHGGIALGVDRLIMLLAGEESIREVIAFPKNQNAVDLMMDSPAPVSPEQLDILHIRITSEEA